MSEIHECIEKFETRKIDNCSGEGYNRCFGVNPMSIEIWYCGQDGIEDYVDEWASMKAKYCPFCGLKSE